MASPAIEPISRVDVAAALFEIRSAVVSTASLIATFRPRCTTKAGAASRSSDRSFRVVARSTARLSATSPISARSFLVVARSAAKSPVTSVSSLLAWRFAARSWESSLPNSATSSACCMATVRMPVIAWNADEAALYAIPPMNIRTFRDMDRTKNATKARRQPHLISFNELPPCNHLLGCTLTATFRIPKAHGTREYQPRPVLPSRGRSQGSLRATT